MTETQARIVNAIKHRVIPQLHQKISLAGNMLDRRAFYMTFKELNQGIEKSAVFNFHQNHIEIATKIDKQHLLRELEIAQSLCQRVKVQQLICKRHIKALKSHSLHTVQKSIASFEIDHKERLHQLVACPRKSIVRLQTLEQKISRALRMSNVNWISKDLMDQWNRVQTDQPSDFQKEVINLAISVSTQARKSIKNKTVKGVNFGRLESLEEDLEGSLEGSETPRQPQKEKASELPRRVETCSDYELLQSQISQRR